jgi:hypothetical protein
LIAIFADPDERRNNGHVRGGSSRGGGGTGSKSQQLIYRPGSGPLKKTGDAADNIEPKSGSKGSSGRHSGANTWRKPSIQLYQPPTNNSRESTPGPPECSMSDRDLALKVSNLSTADNDSSDEKKKGKKPEMAIYVPRIKAQAIAESVDEPPWDAHGGGGGGGRGRGQKKMPNSNSWEQERKQKPDVWDRSKKNPNEVVPEWRKPSNKEQV